MQTKPDPFSATTNKNGLATRDYGTPTFKTEELRLVSNVQL